MWQLVRLQFLILLSSLPLTGCFDTPVIIKSGGAGGVASEASVAIVDTKTDASGVVTASVDSKSKETQVLKLSSEKSGLAGATVSLPPGSLPASTQLVIQQGASLASSLQTSGAGAGKVEAIGVALVIKPTVKKDPILPLTLSLPIGNTQLSLADSGGDSENIAVGFKYIKYGENEKITLGIIPRSELNIVDGNVYFSTPFFGSFQIIRTEILVEIAQELKTKETIVTKIEEIKATEAAKIDNTPPTAASNLYWTADTIGTPAITFSNDFEVTMHWTAGSDAESTIESESLRYFESTKCSGVGTDLAIGNGNNSVTFNTARDGVFTAKIVTTNSRGLATNSVCSVPMTIDSSAPSALSAISITDSSALNTDISFDNDLDITVKWVASTDAGSGISTYFVETFNGGTCTGSPTNYDFVPGNTTLYNFSGSDNTTYSFRISAINNSGLSSSTLCSHSIFLSTTGVSQATNLNIRPDGIADAPVSFDNDHGIYLTWNSASSPNGIVDYAVRVYPSSDCTGTLESNVTGITTTNRSVTVASDGPYSFEIEAFDTQALSATSTCSVPITIDTTAPSAPQDLSFAQNAYNDPSVSVSTINSFFVRFTSGSDAESNIVDHELKIYENTACTGTIAASFTNLNNTYAQFASAYHNARYSFAVRARNGAGGLSSWVCSSSSTTDMRVFITPMTLGLTLGASPSEEINLSWTINTSGHSGIKLLRSTQSGSGFTEHATLAATANTYTDSGLSANTTYYYKVLAYTTGDGIASNEASISTAISPPDPPVNIYAFAPSANTIKISWDSSATATSYKLYLGTTPGVTTGSTSITNITGTDYTHTVSQHSTPFYFRVSAVNGSGEGAISTAEATASTYGNVTTTQSIEALNPESGRKLFYDSVYNKHWIIFANDNMGAKTLNAALDDGTNSWILTGTSIAVDNLAFDVSYKNIGGQPYVFLVYESLGNIKLSRGLITSANIINWDAPQTITTAAAGPPATTYTNPAGAVADNNYVFIAMTERVGVINSVKVLKSNQTANSGTLSFSMTALGDVPNNSTKDIKLDAGSGGTMYITVNDAGAIYSFKYNGASWDDLNTAVQGWSSIHSPNGLNAAPDFVTMFRSNIVAAGAFTYAGGYANAHNIAQTDRKGWRPLGQGINAPSFGTVITAMYKTEQAIYIGGRFAIGDENFQTGIAAWDGETWHDLGGEFTLTTNPNTTTINAITQVGQKIVVGGQFDRINTSIAAANLAIYDLVTETWSVPSSGTDGAVLSLASIANDLYVGGSFTTPHTNISKYSMTDNSWTNIYTTAPNGPVSSIVSSASDVYVAGQFTALNGITNAKVLKYNGTTWSQVGNSSSIGLVTQLVVNGSTLFAGIGAGVANIRSCSLTSCGNWATGGNTGSAVRSITAAGNGVVAASTGVAGTGAGRIHSCSAGVCTEIVPSTVSPIRAVAEVGTKLVLVGDSATMNNVANSRSLALHISTKSWAAGPSVTTGSITDIVPTTAGNAKLLGTFTKQVASYVAATNAVALPTAGFAGAAELLGLWDGTNLTVGGNFNTGLTSNTSAKNIFRYNSDDTVTSLVNGLDAAVYALESDPTSANAFYAGGDFTSGSSVNNLNKVAKWDGTSWAALGPGLPSIVFDLEMLGSNLCAAYFMGLECYDGSSWNPLVGTFLGSAFNVKNSGGYLVAMGNFTSIGGSLFKNIARYDISNGSWQSMAEGLRVNGSISYNDLEVFQGSIIASIGGGNIRHFRPVVASGVSRFETVVLGGNLHIVYENHNGVLQHKKFDDSLGNWTAETPIAGATVGSSFSLSKIEPNKLVMHTQVADTPNRFLYENEVWTSYTPLFDEGEFYNFSCESSMASSKLYCAWMNPVSYPIPMRAMYFDPTSF